MITMTREDIKKRLRLYKRWIEYDIDEHVNVIFSVRTCLRKLIKKKPINDRLLINNIIITSNIFGIEFSYSIYDSICSDEEMTYINSLYYFLKYKKCDPLNSYFIESLHRTCDIYTK